MSHFRLGRKLAHIALCGTMWLGCTARYLPMEADLPAVRADVAEGPHFRPAEIGANQQALAPLVLVIGGVLVTITVIELLLIAGLSISLYYTIDFATHPEKAREAANAIGAAIESVVGFSTGTFTNIATWLSEENVVYINLPPPRPGPGEVIVSPDGNGVIVTTPDGGEITIDASNVEQLAELIRKVLTDMRALIESGDQASMEQAKKLGEFLGNLVVALQYLAVNGLVSTTLLCEIKASLKAVLDEAVKSLEETYPPTWVEAIDGFISGSPVVDRFTNFTGGLGLGLSLLGTIIERFSGGCGGA